MRARVDSRQYTAEVPVKIECREVLDSLDFSDLFDYMLKVHKDDLYSNAKEWFGLVEESNE